MKSANGIKIKRSDSELENLEYHHLINQERHWRRTPFGTRDLPTPAPTSAAFRRVRFDVILFIRNGRRRRYAALWSASRRAR
ncbi:hypothetical protein EVAR_102212_1 [Eumeta japonica]|uniref:Uncharacterized protein n=1 Tax=Eumeta variegata TaxID=151549 RepID=A0A4C1WFU9_EUMVA|nr:hypothetical protein EVAR_102212_1 [Eumeta japonica]